MLFDKNEKAPNVKFLIVINHGDVEPRSGKKDGVQDMERKRL